MILLVRAVRRAVMLSGMPAVYVGLLITLSHAHGTARLTVLIYIVVIRHIA